MQIGTEELRTAVARLIVAGDFQELMNLYAGGDVALPPETIARLYSSEDRQTLDEVREAIPLEVLPPLDRRATAPAEMVELAARFALERGEFAPALRALREAEALDKFCRAYADFAIESLGAGEETRAAFELILAGRLGWARTAPEARREFVTGLGVNAAELAFSLGAESVRGRISGGRALPDFPAWQTYGPLLHARCFAEPCVSDLPLDTLAPLAIRYLLHDPALAERALAAAGDALRLLRILAAETDPDLSDFARRHAQATARYRELHDQRLIRDARLAAAEQQAPEVPLEPAAEPEQDGAEETSENAEDQPEEEPQAPPLDESELDKAEAAREGLREVQALLLGRREKEWRNALAELSATHPLSVFTVCTVRGSELGTFVIPAGERAAEFLAALTGQGS
jgi:hypothetical protein